MKKINNLSKLYTIWNFRKTGTEAMRRKTHIRRGKIQSYVVDTKECGKPVDGKLKEPKF